MNVTNSTAGDCSDTPLPTSDIIICASLVVLSLFILAANLTVIILVGRRVSLRTQTNFCLCSLAASDFMAGLIALPLTIACSSTRCVIQELCLAMDLCQRFLAISTIIHLLVITTERYLMIIYPMVYPRILTKSRILTVLVYTWVISLFVSLIQLAWYDPDHEWKEIPTLPSNDLIYDIFCVTIIVLLPLVFMIYAHIHILVVARKQIRAIKRQTYHLRSANQKTEKMNAQLIYVAMLGVFVTGWIPYFLLAIEADSNHTFFVFPSWLRVISIFFKFFTGLFNPLLYTYFKSDFKREVSLLYRRLKICCCRFLCRCTKPTSSNMNVNSTRGEYLIEKRQEQIIQRVTVV